MSDRVGMPTVGGLRSGMVDYGVGVIASMAYSVSQQFLGTGLLGGLIGAAIAGSVIKGTRGTAVSTILGFQSGLGASIGGGMLGGGSDTSSRGSI